MQTYFLVPDPGRVLHLDDYLRGEPDHDPEVPVRAQPEGGQEGNLAVGSGHHCYTISGRLCR